MNSRYDEDEHEDFQTSAGREINLNAATILGIFVLLAILCAVFFGFGYTLGHKSTPQTPSASVVLPSETAAPSPSVPKHTAGSQIVLPSADTASSPSATAPQQVAQPDRAPDQTAAAADTPQPVGAPVTKPEPQSQHRAAPPAPAPATHPVAAAATANTTPSMVQIAAVSHQEDANILADALKHRGYAVSIVQSSQDKLLHVQIGPFSNRKDAEAMRQRLLNDGYNAIVK
ncbi:SPOR domain-containing protein [Edaphobacter bradus]|uniref:SPOR domain-containing protein n=1 Tax=Edaphobacter bradus TaxID=2259016 RepID=UPI0021DFBBBF|nr:SPOR domain-containing protein [Edaphobacter bradus]